jgi:hypothetical protein
VIFTVQHHTRALRLIGWSRYLQKAGEFADWWTVCNTMVINMLLMYGFSSPKSQTADMAWVNYQLLFCGVIHIIFSSIKVSVFFLQHPLLAFDRELRHVRKNAASKCHTRSRCCQVSSPPTNSCNTSHRMHYRPTRTQNRDVLTPSHACR